MIISEFCACGGLPGSLFSSKWSNIGFKKGGMRPRSLTFLYCIGSDMSFFGISPIFNIVCLRFQSSFLTSSYSSNFMPKEPLARSTSSQKEPLTGSSTLVRIHHQPLLWCVSLSSYRARTSEETKKIKNNLHENSENRPPASQTD